jgi:hypothetical protein
LRRKRAFTRSRGRRHAADVVRYSGELAEQSEGVGSNFGSSCVNAEDGVACKRSRIQFESLDFRHLLVDKEMWPVSNESSGSPGGVPEIAMNHYLGKTETPRLHYTLAGNPTIIVLLNLTKVS